MNSKLILYFLLQFSSKNYGPKPSVSFWRSDVPKMPSLSVTCAAKQETVDKVIEIVRSQLAVGEDTTVTGESKFSELGADSLDTVEIVMELESNFNITVEEESATNILTINDAAEMIENLTTA
ncbi:acyl carrier protein 2, chloroplastic isoform X2 [Silene latifolia]|uniref:acyl carrier protein 2, chloroplastic isoform X2 n=1 Tax=Silene latifolia TaxID=37657 RepID=UPI003D76DE61